MLEENPPIFPCFASQKEDGCKSVLSWAAETADLAEHPWPAWKSLPIAVVLEWLGLAQWEPFSACNRDVNAIAQRNGKNNHIIQRIIQGFWFPPIIYVLVCYLHH